MTVLITGGTGLVGKSLVNLLLAKGYKVIICTRQTGKESDDANVSYAAWDLKKGTIDSSAIAEADHLIHLAGANVGEKRWTPSRKKEIVESRTGGADLLLKAIRNFPNKIKTVVSASAIGWYGEDEIGGPPFTEDDPADNGFLGSTCKAWEAAIEAVVKEGKRLVLIRTGIVLSVNGGALDEFRKPLRYGLAPILGSGKQIISWIHEEDLARIYLAAIENETMQGPYNAVAPQVTDNKELVTQLAEIFRKKFYITLYVPSFIIKLMLGELSIEVLKSTTVSSQKLRTSGFTYLYPSLPSALQNLFHANMVKEQKSKSKIKI